MLPEPSSSEPGQRPCLGIGIAGREPAARGSAACDIFRYQLPLPQGLAVEGWHASCQENVEKTMARPGFDKVVVPQSVNLFMDTPGLEDGRIAWLEAKTKAGDNVVLRAEMDCYLVVSSCPQAILVINASKPSPLAIEVLG